VIKQKSVFQDERNKSEFTRPQHRSKTRIHANTGGKCKLKKSKQNGDHIHMPKSCWKPEEQKSWTKQRGKHKSREKQFYFQVWDEWNRWVLLLL